MGALTVTPSDDKSSRKNEQPAASSVLAGTTACRAILPATVYSTLPESRYLPSCMAASAALSISLGLLNTGAAIKKLYTESAGSVTAFNISSAPADSVYNFL